MEEGEEKSMKVMNFKGRINQRRVRALEGLCDGKVEERKTLVGRIMPQVQAGAIRTKKVRDKKGKDKR